MIDLSKTKLLLCSVFFAVSLTDLVAKVYKVDSQEKFEEINKIKLKPGDEVLLKKGSVFKGMLAPKGLSLIHI